jgi:hypothetical protein
MGDMLLDGLWRVEEEQLQFFQAEGSSGGFAKIIEDGTEPVFFMRSGGFQYHCIIYKLTV